MNTECVRSAIPEENLKMFIKIPICGHNYCSICIQKRHIPNKDFIGCFYYTCHLLAEVDALNNYFFDSMCKIIELIYNR